ncbi:hypothetical protein VTK73DRAFT_7758 [Phialemonium thermophilum]|uniref:DUF8035 domain-containing protein n=1 Tax=Phialemonium thermophilum TaxID=223376 RepID=A0ABR3XS98_9PEZI
MTIQSDTAATALVSNPAASDLRSLHAFVRQLCRRAKRSGSDFDDVVSAVQGLNNALEHLRVEAEDPDSLLNTSPSTRRDSNGGYAVQLMSIIESCDKALQQLDNILQKHGGSEEVTGHSDAARHARRNGLMTARDRDMVELIETKLANQRAEINQFLNKVQLRTPLKSRSVLEGADDRQLDAIKDKLDAVASRVFHSRNTTGPGGEESVWELFRAELEKAGFARAVLDRNKDVLRAYIREIESYGPLEDGRPPTVRGLLVGAFHPPAQHPASPPYPVEGDTSPKESFRSYDNEKFLPDIKQARTVPGQAPPLLNPSVPLSLQPYHHPRVPTLYNTDSALSYGHTVASDDSDSDSSNHLTLALVSTQDLLVHEEAQSTATERLSVLHLSPTNPPSYSFSPGTSPNEQALALPSQPLGITDGAPPKYQPPFSLADSQPPRYVPSVTPYPDSLPSSFTAPSPAYGASPAASHPLSPCSAPPAAALGISDQATRFSRLAPDSRGNQIPLDATWTRIKRVLISPVVLDRAGERYEARPDFVYVLGKLTIDKINEYARQSAEVRNARRPSRLRTPGGDGNNGADKRHSAVKGQRTIPHQAPRHPPPLRSETFHDRERRRRHESDSDSESESDVLWDESDTSEDDRGEHKHGRSYGRKPGRGGVKTRGANDDRDGHPRTYPVIVSPPESVAGGKTSPASTVQPKPILKNTNTNRVRFDEDGPHEFPADSGSYGKSPRAKGKDRDRHRERDREEYERHRSERQRERDREHRRRNHDRDRDRDRDGHNPRSHRDRERDRERDLRHDDRPVKKSTLRETLGAAGIGGAAASLLSVLTEAANGF